MGEEQEAYTRTTPERKPLLLHQNQLWICGQLRLWGTDMTRACQRYIPAAAERQCQQAL